ncbi:MAG: ParB N-terminal domain-containing protein [Planctomycetes bacterium]|nr:ParB N-terminal domain-containing protein [Planctomycetota bacterium]
MPTTPKAETAGRARRISQPTKLALKQLRFDSTNPRIVELVGKPPTTQADIRDVLLGGDMQARELVPSFVENGYLPYEPLIVRPERRNTHVVLEGNRRLAALLSMQESDDPDEQRAFTKHGLERVPCLVFLGDEKDELAYLGLRHLSKTKDWSASAKAAFVERILQSGRTLPHAARITNTTTNNLQLLLLTRRLFERAGEIGLDLPTTSAEGEIAFWHLGDAVRRTNTKQYLQIVQNEDPLQQPELDETRFELLLGWLYGNVKTREPKLIRSIRDIPDLVRCLAHARSLKALENGQSLSEALEELQAAGANVTAHLERAKKSIQRATGLLSDLDETGKEQVQQTVGELKKALDTFKRALSD